MTRHERLTMLIDRWRQRAKENRPAVVDTEGKLALSTMAMMYEGCADQLERILKAFPR